jgi:hypothetical protein
MNMKIRNRNGEVFEGSTTECAKIMRQDANLSRIKHEYGRFDPFPFY